MNDLVAVAWKEWRELLGQRGFRGKQGIGLFLLAFGIVLPLQSGPGWITSPMTAVAWSWVPMFLVSTVIADAIAGERERHTLETLLASRLSDDAILFGKIGAAIAYAAVVTVASLLLGLIAVNVANRGQGLVLYPLSTIVAMCVLGLLGAMLVATIGVLISLRAATVRQAQQTLGGTIIALLLVPMMAVRWMPAAWKQGLLSNAVSGALLGIAALAAFVLIDAGLVALVMARFRRAWLIAD